MSNSDNPLVSVIVPAYNAEPYIDKCIRSLTAQTYWNIEIIAVNDGSKDISGAIIEDIAKTDERIRFINQPNQGVCIARNNGIDMARGEYLLFVDGDDFLEPDYVEALATAAMANDSDLVIGGYTIDDNTKLVEVIPLTYEAGKDEMWAYRIMATWGHLYRRSFWDRNVFRFTTEAKVRAEDTPICLMANYLGRNIALARNSGYHYVQHEDSAMKQFKGLRLFSFPKQAFEKVSAVLNTEDYHNGREFMVYGILKTFAQFSFQLSKGADKKTRKELDQYFINYVKTNIPDYFQCWRRARRGSLPLYIRMAVLLFCLKVTIG